MDSLDRLDWAAGLSFTAYGRRIGIRVNDSAALERLPEHLPFGWRPSASPIVEHLYSLIIHQDPAGARVRRLNILYGATDR